jgi:predicted 3-demethylubiquinone-9 3-methyltransferase (glyoxalase superfamily)
MFPTGCAEAVKHYTSTFKDGRIHRLGSMGKGPDGTELVNAEFEVGGQRFNAMDGGPSFSFAQGISLFVGCDTQEEIDHFWNALTKDGGEPGRCGWLTDKWGISWQIVPSHLVKMLSDRKAGNTGAAMQAMLQMDKLDIKTLEKAYRS